jgi:hypothetical protein
MVIKPAEKWYNDCAKDSCLSRFFMPNLALKKLICYYQISAPVAKRLTLSLARSEPAIGAVFVFEAIK